MPTGTVKWFEPRKGYGFIELEDGSGDIFVHYTGIKGEGFRALQEGDRVKFDVVKGSKGDQAVEVEKLEGE